MVIRSTEQVAAEVWVPGEAVAFFLVASQPQIWCALSRRIFSKKLKSMLQQTAERLQKL